MVTPLSIKDFLTFAHKHPIIDVRAPQEFINGHIPGACNIPLLSDDQRAVVGTMYKQQGKNEAIRVGLELVGPQLKNYIDAVEALNSKTVLVYCARGGMRSKSFCMLLATCGYRAYQLINGYKGFKQYLCAQAEKPYKIILLGGKTGSGKTALLHELQNKGEQVVDLEGLAHHRGSVFGPLHQAAQPSQEQFIVNCLSTLAACDPNNVIWIEKESYKIGNLSIPSPLWLIMAHAPTMYINIPREQRLTTIMTDYGTATKEQLTACVKILTKKLGGARTQQLCTELDSGNIVGVADSLIDYYDQLYAFSLEKNKDARVCHLEFKHETVAQQAEIIKAKSASLMVLDTSVFAHSGLHRTLELHGSDEKKIKTPAQFECFVAHESAAQNISRAVGDSSK